MHETLKRYFGDTLSDKIISQKGELEGENKWVTILFADLSSVLISLANAGVEIALSSRLVESNLFNIPYPFIINLLNQCKV